MISADEEELEDLELLGVLPDNQDKKRSAATDEEGPSCSKIMKN